jgi:hypothetical protein
MSQEPEKETRLSLWLFGKPAWEIKDLEGGDVTPKLLKEIEALGKELQERLQWITKVSRELLTSGWDGYGTLYDIDFLKAVSLEQAKKELKQMGLNPDDFNLEEEEIEDDIGEDSV